MSSMEYKLGKVIGRGGFSTVRLGTPANQGDKIPNLIAVKSSKLSQETMLLREESILKEFEDCQYIIQCFGSDYSTEEGEKMCNLLLEYAPGGNLSDKLKKQSNCRFPESEVRRYTKSILEGIVCIHKKGYVHRDIKLENILVFSEDSLKIADFGVARRANESVKGGEVDFLKLQGTLLYLSPEALSKVEQEPPADVWALGCIVAEMISGVPLWKSRQGEDVVALMMRIALCEEVPEIFGGISLQARDFLGKILIKDPAQRWTAKMLLDHPFIVDEWRGQAVAIPSSPRGPLDWNSGYESSKLTCSVTKKPSSKLNKGKGLSFAERFKRLVMCQGQDWAVSKSLISQRK